jgi:hypothetical protein
MLIDRAVRPRRTPDRLRVAAPRRVVDAAAAREVGRMMELTTRIGHGQGNVPRQARAAAAARRGRGQDRHPVGRDGPRLRGLQLVRRLRPADTPTIAFAVVLGNNPTWRIKATYVGRHIVSEVLAAPKARRPACRV